LGYYWAGCRGSDTDGRIAYCRSPNTARVHGEPKSHDTITESRVKGLDHSKLELAGNVLTGLNFENHCFTTRPWLITGSAANRSVARYTLARCAQTFRN
jgi:hypothetical protein